ncbi:flavonol 4'-sulfotransferase [Quercus suber]|uniref:Sulfotransferase n=1 Tax=Quercus suber TaxID=58331 RepID=A0AAW0IJG2_QUESU
MLNLDVPLVATHIRHTLLPKSIIQYICRDPNDVFVSSWHFVCNMSPKAVDASAREDRSFISRKNLSSFFDGIYPYGPYWDHVLGYWRANLEVKKITQIIGYPFSLEDENKDVVHNIINLYSFENLSGLNVNKSGITHFRGPPFKNNTFFRKSKIGDWKNHLTPKMAMLLNKITEHPS